MRATFFGSIFGFAIPLLVFALPASAQQGHGHNGFGVHAPPPSPSVTSMSPFGVHAPPPLPSVTSLPNDNFRFNNRPFFNGNGHRGRRNSGFPFYTTPYYSYPLDSSGYGYDYVGSGGPDLYSGPPPGPNDQILHVIVEQPAVGAYGPPRDEQRAEVAEPTQQHAAVEDAKPGEPTVLVFRNGKHEEVTNYAIMGETLYVFDQGRKKVALADLDIAATVKANDDRGMEFRVPATLKKKAAPAPQSATPNDASEAPRKVAGLTVSESVE